MSGNVETSGSIYFSDGETQGTQVASDPQDIDLTNAGEPTLNFVHSQQGRSSVPAPLSGDSSRRRTRGSSRTPERDNTSGGEQEKIPERVTKVQLVERDTIQVMEQLSYQAAQIQHLINQVSDE